jgi:hypothetical protein
MGSDMFLTPSQLKFWWAEGHHMDGRPAIALIYPDGLVELDYQEGDD